jgi:sulfur carrier protein
MAVSDHRYPQSIESIFTRLQAATANHMTQLNIVVNGITRQVSPGTTIAALLEQLELSSKHLAVEVNLELVPRAKHDVYQLQESDRLEVVSLVGGG